jgi:hypothetical protein
VREVRCGADGSVARGRGNLLVRVDVNGLRGAWRIRARAHRQVARVASSRRDSEHRRRQRGGGSVGGAGDAAGGGAGRCVRALGRVLLRLLQRFGVAHVPSQQLER